MLIVHILVIKLVTTWFSDEDEKTKKIDLLLLLLCSFEIKFGEQFHRRQSFYGIWHCRQ